MIHPTLRFGSRGEPVELLQRAFNQWTAPACPPLTVDGIYGQKTTSTARRFQSSHALVPDGVDGPLTWETVAPIP
jgi:peptidoglycan hydrolase-like protein with peptidoglycan-binding domain